MSQAEALAEKCRLSGAVSFFEGRDPDMVGKYGGPYGEDTYMQAVRSLYLAPSRVVLGV